MNAIIIKYARHYLWGLGAVTFNGGITGIVGLGIMEEQNKLPEGITRHVLFHTFAVAGVVHLLMYFKQHPLPEQLPDPAEEDKPKTAIP